MSALGCTYRTRYVFTRPPCLEFMLHITRIEKIAANYNWCICSICKNEEIAQCLILFPNGLGSSAKPQTMWGLKMSPELITDMHRVNRPRTFPVYKYSLTCLLQAMHIRTIHSTWGIIPHVSYLHQQNDTDVQRADNALRTVLWTLYLLFARRLLTQDVNKITHMCGYDIFGFLP